MPDLRPPTPWPQLVHSLCEMYLGIWMDRCTCMTDQEEQHTHYVVRQAIEWHLDDLEDIHLADLGL